VAVKRPDAGAGSRAFVNEDAGDPIWGFEGPTTSSGLDDFHIMGVKINMANGDLSEFTSIPSLADTRAFGAGRAGDLCPTGECSWREVNPVTGDFGNLLPGEINIAPDDSDFSLSGLSDGGNWFGQQMTDYEVERGEFFQGSLPNFITKMTAGLQAAGPSAGQLEPMTIFRFGGDFVEDSFIFEPRENVIGGEVIRHDCVASAEDFTLAEWGACHEGFYYTVNEVVVVPSTLRGFPTVDFTDIVVRWDSGQETTFIGHFIKQDGVSETDRFQGLFYIREEEFEPAPVEEEEPCEEEPCEPAPVVVEPLLSIYEGPITRLSESASPGPVSIASPETWNIMWIMGCPVHIHPDLILDGPTVDDEPIRGASLFELLDEDDDRGHALSIIGATGKGVAERVGQIYVMQEIVVELAENVIIYPDASAAADFDGTSNVLKLFPVVGSPESFQMKVKLSEDRNFPGSWLDAGGEALDDQSVEGLHTALTSAPDWSLGLGGYFSISDDGDGTAGTFYVVEGETTALPATLPAVLINRYRLRYDTNDGEVRMEIRGQYVSDEPIQGDMEVSLAMKYDTESGGDGAFPCQDATECLVLSELGTDKTGMPGRIFYDDDTIDESEDCEVDPEFPNVCSFRIRVRQEEIRVDGLGVTDTPWPEYHSSLKLQYMADVFIIVVTADDGEDTEVEATPGRIRVD
tara:strand:- start:957 stop:3020 length:2064 start_codon:yes stop_codon:yes gene_type:complete